MDDEGFGRLWTEERTRRDTWWGATRMLWKPLIRIASCGENNRVVEEGFEVSEMEHVEVPFDGILKIESSTQRGAQPFRVWFCSAMVIDPMYESDHTREI